MGKSLLRTYHLDHLQTAKFANVEDATEIPIAMHQVKSVRELFAEPDNFLGKLPSGWGMFVFKVYG